MMECCHEWLSDKFCLMKFYQIISTPNPWDATERVYHGEQVASGPMVRICKRCEVLQVEPEDMERWIK